MHEPTVNRVIRIISASIPDPTRLVHPDSDLVADINLDSLTVLQLLLDLENEFQINDLDYDPEHMQTVLDVANIIDGRLASIHASTSTTSASNGVR